VVIPYSGHFHSGKHQLLVFENSVAVGMVDSRNWLVLPDWWAVYWLYLERCYHQKTCQTEQVHSAVTEGWTSVVLLQEQEPERFQPLVSYNHHHLTGPIWDWLLLE
jgi:hypothetical protein